MNRRGRRRRRAHRTYRLLVRLYPAAHRRAFGDDMVLAFGDHYADAVEGRGESRLRFWLAVLADARTSLLTEYAAEAGVRHRPRRPAWRPGTKKRRVRVSRRLRYRRRGGAAVRVLIRTRRHRLVYRGRIPALIAVVALTGAAFGTVAATGHLGIAVLLAGLFVAAWLAHSLRLTRPVSAGPRGDGPTPPGGASVREPRRPLPICPTGAAARPTPDQGRARTSHRPDLTRLPVWAVATPTSGASHLTDGAPAAVPAALRSGSVQPIERIVNAQPASGARDEASSLVEQAQAHLAMAENAQALALAVRAEALVEDSSDRRVLAAARSVISTSHQRLDRYAESIEVGLEAVRLWHDLGDLSGESMARSTIARVLILTGDLNEALDESLIALEMAELSGELRPRLLALTAVGIVHLCLRKYETSIEYCERGAETARLLDDAAAYGSLIDTLSCVYLGMAYTAREDGDEPNSLAHCALAIDHSRQAMEIARGAGHRYYEVNALGNLAEALAFAGRPAEALDLMKTIEVDPAVDAISTVTQHLDARGCIHLAMKEYDQAAEFFGQALELSAGNNTAMLYCEHLAEAYEGSGNLRAALDYYKRFHTLFAAVASEAAQRSAGIAAIRLETARAKDYALVERARAEELHHSNLELTKHAESLLQQSLEDPLTGLANRRSLDRLLVADGPRYSVALLDVDHFKQVNDGFSHQVGDEVLRQLGALLQQSCRPADHAARYGGEEFALLLSGLGAEAAVKVAERLRRRVAAFDWTRIAAGLQITVSIGVAAVHEADAAARLLEIADRRLYDAKHEGRNRVAGPIPADAATAH